MPESTSQSGIIVVFIDAYLAGVSSTLSTSPYFTASSALM